MNVRKSLYLKRFLAFDFIDRKYYRTIIYKQIRENGVSKALLLHLVLLTENKPKLQNNKNIMADRSILNMLTNLTVMT